MKTFTIKFALLFFVSLLPFSIFSGDRPTAARIAYECAWAALYSAKKDALKVRRQFAHAARKHAAVIHKPTSSRTLDAFNNLEIIERDRYVAYCKYALLTARANEINEFTPPFKQIDIPEFIPLKTLK